MRVIMLSWEYPPKIVGGISRHVYDLAHALVKLDIEVHVVTCEHPGAPAEEVEDGIHIYRVTPSGPGNDFIHWVQLLNDAMLARADTLVAGLLDKADGMPLLLHPHDWLAHFAAAALKHKYHLPLVATIHATEYGRNNGIKGPTQEYINSVESQLQNEAWRVIVCTHFMERECHHALYTPWDKMDVIPNGVDAAKFKLPDFTPEEKAAFRARYAAPEEKIIFFVGRMVREKGVQVLIESLPKVRWGYHDAKLLICGGGQREHLVNLAAYLGMERHVYFAGFVPDDDLLKIYSIIDIACFPLALRAVRHRRAGGDGRPRPRGRLRRRRPAGSGREQRHRHHHLCRQPGLAGRRPAASIARAGNRRPHGRSRLRARADDLQLAHHRQADDPDLRPHLDRVWRQRLAHARPDTRFAGFP